MILTWLLSSFRTLCFNHMTKTNMFTWYSLKNVLISAVSILDPDFFHSGNLILMLRNSCCFFLVGQISIALCVSHIPIIFTQRMVYNIVFCVLPFVAFCIVITSIIIFLFWNNNLFINNWHFSRTQRDFITAH